MNLLFDLDGTLADPGLGITGSFQKALQSLTGSAPGIEALGWCVGPPLHESFARLLQTEDEARIQEAILRYRQFYTSEGIHLASLYPGTLECLRELKARGHQLRVATSKPQPYAERIIQALGLEPFFLSIHGPAGDNKGHEKAQLIEKILKTFALRPSDTLMIGDRKHDMIGARSNALHAIGVLWGYGSQEELLSTGACACVKHYPELSALLA